MDQWTTWRELWSMDPWWFLGSAFLFFLVTTLFFLSFLRNIRSLAWFYVAMVFTGLFYNLFLLQVPAWMEAIASYRADWSLIYLVQDFSVRSLVTQLVFFFALYGGISVGALLILLGWSLLTFRWQRLKILLSRAYEDSWYVSFFSLFTLVSFGLVSRIVPMADSAVFHQFFVLFSFLFTLQLVIRLLDSAQLHTPALFWEFAYSTACVFFLFRMVFMFFFESTLSIHEYFLSQLFSFFLMILLVGYVGSFLLKTFFVSPFFLEHVSLSTRYFNISREKYPHYQVLLGVFFSLLLGNVFLLMLSLGYVLPLVLVFFAGFFLLFYFLDQIEDMRLRGDIVEKRLQSGLHRTFLR